MAVILVALLAFSHMQLPRPHTHTPISPHPIVKGPWIHLGSTFALRNIVKGKRFIFWDDFRPVEFAHKDTIPIATFLSLFIGKDTEVQVSQSFNDGNLDVCWKKGVVFTAKESGLWESTSKVSAEDVRHLRNRVEEFRFTHTLASLKDVDSCAPCMSRWIVKYSEEAAMGPLMPPPMPGPQHGADWSRVNGFAEFIAVAKLDGPVVGQLFADVVAAGAVDVSELGPLDWPQLPSWQSLRPLEARRVRAAVGGP